MLKETKLNDNATIYNRSKDQQTERQKLSEMSLKQKWTYFNDYYRNKLLLFLLVFALVFSLAYSMLFPKNQIAFYVAAIDDMLDEDKLDEFQLDFGSHIGLDNKKDVVVFNSNFYLNSTNSQISMPATQQFVTYLSAGQIDVIIADAKYFEDYVKNGWLDNLSNVLPTDLYSKMSDKFFIASTSEDPEERAYGISLKDNAAYKDLGTLIEDPVMGVVLNSEHKNSFVDFVEYFFK